MRGWLHIWGRQMNPVMGITPPPKALPKVMTSGTTSSASQRHMVPVRPMPVWISSRIRGRLCSSQILRTSFR